MEARKAGEDHGGRGRSFLEERMRTQVLQRGKLEKPGLDVNWKWEEKDNTEGESKRRHK